MGVNTDRYSASFTELPVRLVACPSCKGGSVFHPSNPSRPFCSPKCRAVDLGAWANEDFRLAEGSRSGDAYFNAA